MEFLPDEKQPNPYYTSRGKYVGKVKIEDGLVDITDPCYDSDTWCAYFGYQVKPGTYHAFIDIANFPSKVRYAENDYEVLIGKAKPNRTVTLHDRRIVQLLIQHESIEGTKIPDDAWTLVNDSIGVDAGMCGFYNHKPSFDDEDSWTDFWQNAKSLPKLKHLTCDIKPYGVTVTSGFGDGMYPLSKYEVDGQVVALRVNFN